MLLQPAEGMVPNRKFGEGWVSVAGEAIILLLLLVWMFFYPGSLSYHLGFPLRHVVKLSPRECDDAGFRLGIP